MPTKAKEKETVKPADAAQAIAEKAAKELQALHEQIQDLHQARTCYVQEREQLLTERARRTDVLQTVRSGLASLEAKHKAAEEYATYAQGTIGEQEAVKQLSAVLVTLEPARTSAAEQEAQYAEAEQHTTTSLGEIDKELARISQEHEQAAARILEVERVRDRAIRELGQHTYDALMQEYQHHQEKLDVIRGQLLTAQIARRQFIDQAAATLASWPALQKQVRNLDPYDDATTRVLSAALAYIETLLADGANLVPSMNLPGVPALSNYYNWVQALEISRDGLYLHETLRGPKKLLHRQQALLQDTLSQYVRTKS